MKEEWLKEEMLVIFVVLSGSYGEANWFEFMPFFTNLTKLAQILKQLISHLKLFLRSVALLFKSN